MSILPTQRIDGVGIETKHLACLQTYILSHNMLYVEVLYAVEDIDGDYVQCRWAQSIRGECDDLCSLLLPGTLNASTVSVKNFHNNILIISSIHTV